MDDLADTCMRISYCRLKRNVNALSQTAMLPLSSTSLLHWFRGSSIVAERVHCHTVSYFHLWSRPVHPTKSGKPRVLPHRRLIAFQSVLLEDLMALSRRRSIGRLLKCDLGIRNMAQRGCIWVVQPVGTVDDLLTLVRCCSSAGTVDDLLTSVCMLLL